MFSILSNSDKMAYGVKAYVLDLKSDLSSLPTNITPGSIAFIIESSQYYMLNTQGNWVAVTFCSSDGSSSEGGDTFDEVIYDGGLV